MYMELLIDFVFYFLSCICHGEELGIVLIHYKVSKESMSWDISFSGTPLAVTMSKGIKIEE